MERPPPISTDSLVTSGHANAVLWTLVGLLTGGLRTFVLARTRRWLTLVLDVLVGMSGALALTRFVWPLHGSPGASRIALSGLLWGFVGAVFSLCMRQVISP